MRAILRIWQALWVWAVLSWAGMALAQPADGPPAALSLANCIELAQHHSPLVLAARENIEVFEAKASEAWWGWFPEIKLRATVGPSPAHRGNALDGTTDFSQWGVLVDLRIDGTMPLYTCGKIAALKRAAAAGIDVAREQLQLARGEVTVRVRKAYHGYQFALALDGILRDGQRFMDQVRRELEKLRDADDDDFDQIDLLRLRVQAADLESLVLENRRLQDESLLVLEQLVGGGLPQHPLVLSEPELHPVNGVLQPLEHYLIVAAGHNPLVLMAQQGVRARQALADFSLAQLLPDFFVGGQYNITYANASDPQSSPFVNDPWNSWGGGGALGMRYKFDLPRGLARRRQAQAELAKTRYDQRAARDLTDLQVEQAFRKVSDQQQLMAAHEQSRRAAHAWYRAQRDLYESGFCTVKDVLDALTQYDKRWSNHLRSVYDYNVAWAELEQAVGQSLLGP